MWLGTSCGSDTKKNDQTRSAPVVVQETEEIDLMAYSDAKGVGPITEYEMKPFDAALANRGQEIFNSMCIICHQIENKVIGPPMKGITKRRTPEWILNMTLNPERMVKEDELAKALLVHYNNIPMNNQGLSKEEAIAVLEYLRQVDGAE
jgi:cytochrome c551/c552